LGNIRGLIAWFKCIGFYSEANTKDETKGNAFKRLLKAEQRVDGGNISPIMAYLKASIRTAIMITYQDCYNNLTGNGGRIFIM